MRRFAVEAQPLQWQLVDQEGNLPSARESPTLTYVKQKFHLACTSVCIMSYHPTHLLHPSLSHNVHCLPLASSAVNEDLYLYGGVDQEETFVCALGLYVFSTGMHLHWGASVLAMTSSFPYSYS